MMFFLHLHYIHIMRGVYIYIYVGPGHMTRNMCCQEIRPDTKELPEKKVPPTWTDRITVHNIYGLVWYHCMLWSYGLIWYIFSTSTSQII